MTYPLSQSASRLYIFNTSPLRAGTLCGARPVPRLLHIAINYHIAFYRPARRNQYSIASKVKEKINPEAVEAMEAVKQTIAQNMGVSGAHTLVPEDQQFDLKDTPDLHGKIAVITGGSEGIGYGCTYTLLSKGIEKVFVISVSEDVIEKSIKTIKEEIGEEAGKKVVWLQCDLADWKAVKETADKIAKSTNRIDILINNAARGIMTYQLTDYGIDRHVRSFAFIIYARSMLTTIDGHESYVPRHPDLPPAAHPQEDCFIR